MTNYVSENCKFTMRCYCECTSDGSDILIVTRIRDNLLRGRVDKVNFDPITGERVLSKVHTGNKVGLQGKKSSPKATSRWYNAQFVEWDKQEVNYCPNCGSGLQFKMNKSTKQYFMGCKGFTRHSCRFTFPL